MLEKALRGRRLVSHFMVLKECDKERPRFRVSEPSWSTMGKQSLFQSLYNKYGRRNVYSGVYSKVFLTWVSEVLIFLSACESLRIIMDLEQGVSAYY